MFHVSSFPMKYSRLALFLPLFCLACGVPRDEHAAVVASRDSLMAVVAGNNKTIDDLNSGIRTLTGTVMEREKRISELSRRIDSLAHAMQEAEATYRTLKSNSSAEIQNLFEQLDKARADLSAREQRLREAEQKLKSRDSVMNALRQTLSNALLGFRESGLTVDIRNGKVYVSLSNQLLFKSGSTSIDSRGQDALRELATVLNSQPDIAILVEGHTDNVPVSGGTRFTDNWELSVLRSTEVVHFMVNSGHIDPKRITAAGRGEYHPVREGDTQESRAANRRTEIILTPKLDELFDVLK